MNIFNKILKELPYPNNKIIANDLKDQQIADQMSQLINCILNEEREKFIKDENGLDQR